MSANMGVSPRDEFHKKLLTSRLAKDTSQLKVSRNYQSMIILALILVCGWLILNWQTANSRFANNVRVSYVKLSPNGTYNVEYEDENKPVDFFKATVDSKLSEFIQKRYSKLRNSITYDYGFANLFLSPQLSNQFLNDFNAPEVAAKHVECANCSDEEWKVRNIQGITADVRPNTKNDTQYTTLVFARARKISEQGYTTECTNKIVTLLWHFRGKSEVVSKRDQLQFNPLGMEILRADVKSDPTPVDPTECAKS